MTQRIYAMRNVAGPGQIFLCRSCGKTNKRRLIADTPGWDESCALNAMLIEESSIERDKYGHIIEARGVEA
jgi:hypothetical protein